MFSPLTLENRLILACARTDPDVDLIAKLVERDPDWQTIVRRAEQWGIVPLVYTSLRPFAMSDQVPKPVAEQLRHLFRRETIHSVGQRELLGISLMRFVEAGIPVIVLHGMALATLVYPAPNLRPIIDIDLLIHAHNHDQAESLLAGIQADYPSTPYLGPWGIHQIKLHEQLATARGSASRRAADAGLATEDVWQRAQPAQIESVTTLVLSHEDLLLQLALQLWASDRVAGHVKTLCDIGETCRRYTDAIDWGRLVMQAERYQVAKQLAYALDLARDLVGADVPTPALVALRASFGQLPFEDRFIAAVARDAILSDAPPSTWYTLGAQLVATDRATDGFKFASRSFARSCRASLRQLGTDLSERWARVSHSIDTTPFVDASPIEAQHTDAPQPIEEPTPTEASQLGGITHSPGELAVTYDQQGASDGVGAQVQRIYGLYALARTLGLKYVHTPLERVDYQGFTALLNRNLDPNFVERYNAFFALPSDDFDLEGCERIKIHNLNLATVERYRAQATMTGRSILLQTLLPFAYTDKNPAAYRTLHEVSPYRDHQPSGPIRVCIHMRRGDNLPDSRRRWLPNSYYLRVCGQIIEALEQQGAPYTLLLHSELPTRRYALYPASPGLYFEPEQPVTIDPADYVLEDFDALPNLEMVFNAEPLDALKDFATADVLILSASSFGYLGAMLNPHGVVVFAPFTWNAALPDWLVADEHGNLNTEKLTSQIRNLLARRQAVSDGIATLEVSHNAGLASCLSVRLHEVARYRADHGRYPDNVDSSNQFQWYADKEGQNIAAMLLAPVSAMEEEDGPYIHFHYGQQFAWYRHLDLQGLQQLSRKYCWPSQKVIDVAHAIMRSMQGRTAVLYRGNDKIQELPRTPYQTMFEMAERSGAEEFWVQTDEAEFFDAFKARFPNTSRIEELPMIRRDDTASVLPDTGKAEFAVTFLAALYAIAHAPQIICTTGNTAVWPMIFRGHTRGVWQYYDNYPTYVYE